MARAVLYDRIGIVHSNAGNGLLADHFGGAAVPTSAPINLNPMESKHLYVTIKCGTKTSVPTYIRKQMISGSLVSSTYSPLGMYPSGPASVPTNSPYSFVVVLTSNDVSFDVLPNVADTVDLTIEEDAIM